MRPNKTITDYQAELDALDRTMDQLCAQRNELRARRTELALQLTPAQHKAANAASVAFDYPNKPERAQAAKLAKQELSELENQISDVKKKLVANNRENRLAALHRRQIDVELRRAKAAAERLADARALVADADKITARRIDEARELIADHDQPDAAA